MTDPLTPDQRRAVDEMLQAALGPINERLDRGADKMSGLSTEVNALRGELKANTETTVEVRDLLDVGKGGLRVLGWFGVAAKWITVLATAGVSLMALVHAIKTGGQVPPHKP